MTDTDDLKGGLREMDYRMVRSTPTLEVPSSTPATFTFQGDTGMYVDAFIDALEAHDFSVRRLTHDTDDSGDFYCYATIMTDHYKEVRVKVWRETARIYPDAEPPDRWEFSRIVHAIEDAFGAELTHTPEAD